MIVFDTSALVGAVVFRDTPPRRAFQHAFDNDIIALSDAVHAETMDVLFRPRLGRFLNPVLRSDVVQVLRAHGVWFEPETKVTDCRDPGDNKFLELALAARASIIVSSDNDLLVLNPWRGVRILRPAEYLTSQTA